MAPASPTPLMPSALSGEGVSVWPIVMSGISTAVGIRKSMNVVVSGCPLSS